MSDQDDLEAVRIKVIFETMRDEVATIQAQGTALLTELEVLARFCRDPDNAIFTMSGFEQLATVGEAATQAAVEIRDALVRHGFVRRLGPDGTPIEE